jgi:glycosyltransferase involved in cell wall biosynthesis
MQIAVITCTHNPRPDYFQRVLDALRAQTLPQDQWELLLIDNASSELLAKAWDLSWHPHGRCICEPQLGLGHARLRSIQEAAAEVLVFVDDDNVLAPDYLAESLRIGREWLMLGAWGGQQFPEFEGGEPAEAWKRELWTGKLARDIWSNNYDREAAPVGSGLCVRRVVASRYAELVQGDGLRQSLGRRGAGLNSGEDIDLDYVACDMGLGLGRFRSLWLTHLIPAKRLTDEYLYKLCEGFGYSEVILEAVRGGRPQRPSRVDRLVARYKILRMGGRQPLEESARKQGRARALAVLENYWDEMAHHGSSLAVRADGASRT